MINTKQVVPALVAVTLLSLAPAAEALAIEEHAQAAKPAAVAADKPAAAKPAEAKADTKTDAKADVKTQAPAATDPAKETPAPSVEQAQKAYDNGSYEEAFIIVEPLAKLEHPDAEYLLGQMYELGRGVKKDTATSPHAVHLRRQSGLCRRSGQAWTAPYGRQKRLRLSHELVPESGRSGAMPSPTAPSAICTPRATAWGKIRARPSTTIRKPLPPATPTLVCTSAKCTNRVRTSSPIRHRPPSGTRRARISAAPNVPPP